MSQVTHDAIIGEPEVVEDARGACRRHEPRLAATEGRGEHPPHPPGAGWQRPGRRDASRRPRPRDRRSPRASPPLPRCSRTTPSTSSAVVTDFDRWADGGFGVPDFYDSLRRLPAGAAPRRRPAAPRRVPDVHAERQHRPARRGGDRRGDLARVHRRARGRRLLEQAVRVDAVRRLHRRLRHELGGAVPRDRRDARDPDLHLGRDLRGPRGRPLPPRRARGRRGSPSSTCPPTPRACSTTSSSPRRPS